MFGAKSEEAVWGVKTDEVNNKVTEMMNLMTQNILIMELPSVAIQQLAQQNPNAYRGYWINW